MKDMISWLFGRSAQQDRVTKILSDHTIWVADGCVVCPMHAAQIDKHHGHSYCFQTMLKNLVGEPEVRCTVNMGRKDQCTRIADVRPAVWH